jgi:hypothetical protein
LPFSRVPGLGASFGIEEPAVRRGLLPDPRKAKAAKAAVQGPVTPAYPASITQQHPDGTIGPDPPVAALLAER